ncbi:hypothetical protein C4D60_Mb04t38800 [Musa balbisiana]|uniref:Uncharacterized protein n=1 Tax=Musa balbisiana TaxID=52838 RepID=A0A4S8KI13_MUSBA|nr:hypothetical protein C4D60_Mb04t38800 [Musa balbisiana]
MTLAVDVARRVVVASNEGVAVVARHLSATDVNRVSPHHLGVVPTRLARDAAVAVVVVVPPLGDPVVDVVGLRVPGGALEDVLPVGASGVHELTVRLSPVGVAPGVHERGRTPTLDRTELWARRKSCTELRALMAGSMAHDRDKDPQANLIFVFSLSLSMTDRTRRPIMARRRQVESAPLSSSNRFVGPLDLLGPNRLGEPVLLLSIAPRADPVAGSHGLGSLRRPNRGGP